MEFFKYCCVILALICSALGSKDLDFQENSLDFPAESVEQTSKGVLLSLKAKQALQKFLNRMPCGWPEYNVPQLAPYKLHEYIYSGDGDFNSYFCDFNDLQVDGLNEMLITDLTFNLGFYKQVQFDFNFPSIQFVSNYNGNYQLDIHNLTGNPVMWYSTGQLNLTLTNLRLTGIFAYKLPFLVGSAKIYNLDMAITVDSVSSHTTGFLNDIPINQELNKHLETHIAKILTNKFGSNDYVTRWMNELLQGKKFWNLFWWSLKPDLLPSRPCPQMNNQ